jgi:hypothetical protein
LICYLSCFYGDLGNLLPYFAKQAADSGLLSHDLE